MMTYISPDPAPRPPESASPPPKSTAGLSSLQERQRWRFWMLGIALLAFTGIIVLRLVIYQVWQWGFTVPAGQGHTGPASRGTIVDRNGLLLAADRYNYSVAVNATRLTNDEDRRTLANQLEELIGAPANQTLALLNQYPTFPYLELRKQVPLAQAKRIPEMQQELGAKFDIFPLQAVFITPVPKRYYPQGKLAGHLVGFVNMERKPFYGLESYYDRFLIENSGIAFTNEPQKRIDQLDADVRRYLPSLASKDLVLTLDSAVQWIIEEELQRGMNEFKAVSGTIIVIEPETGAILGMASLPGYDPNRYGDAKYEEFLDPAISAQYEPGSVFKVVTMGAALDTGVITPTMMFNDTGHISVGGRPIFNSQLIGYGWVSAEMALARSLNVVTAQIAVNVGKSQFYDYVRRFGFGSATQIDLAGEIPGALKTPGTLDWSESDLGTNSFGQGLAATPLQMANAVAAIANGGKLMRPYVVQARIHDGLVLETEPTVVHAIMAPEHAAELAGMMITAVEEGNPRARVSGYEVAGKSGTAQIPTVAGYLKDQVNASFIGFVPARAPRFAMIVRLEKPDQAVTLWASENAAVIFSRASKRILDYMNVPPDSLREAVALQ